MTDKSKKIAQYEGMCHCGNVRFTVSIALPLTIEECNCSICSKTGFLHILIPSNKLRILSGGPNLFSYTFGTATAKHLFCRFCGVKAFYVPRSHPTGYSINARCLKNFKIGAHNMSQFDGRNYESNISALQKKVDFLDP